MNEMQDKESSATPAAEKPMDEEESLYEVVWEARTPAPPRRTASLRPESKKRRYDINDFSFLKVLGKGSFGKARALYIHFNVILSNIDTSIADCVINVE